MVRTMIIDLNNSKKLSTMKWGKKLFNKKTGNLIFFVAKIDLSICPDTYEFF